MHVSYILTGVGDCRPLTDELGNRLLSGQRVPAVKMMDCKHSGFITARLSRCVYTGSDKQRVVSVSPDTCDNRNEIFLNMIARKSQTALFNFISALNDISQMHVVVVLIGVEIVRRVKAFFDSEAGNINLILPNVIIITWCKCFNVRKL